MSAKYKMKLYQGATFERVVQWKDSAGSVVPLTGMTARFTVRARTYDGTVALNLTTETGEGITINLSTNKMTIKATAEQTGAMPIDDYIYILEVKDISNNQFRLLEGSILFYPEVLDVI